MLRARSWLMSVASGGAQLSRATGRQLEDRSTDTLTKVCLSGSRRFNSL